MENVAQTKAEKMDSATITLIKFHVGNCLPFIHGHKPGIVFTPATKVDNEFRLVVVQGFEHRLEPCKGEGAEGKEIGGYDHLLLASLALGKNLLHWLAPLLDLLIL
jgi:hypothetical protein